MSTSDQRDQDIQAAAGHLATLLRSSNADKTYVESVLSNLRATALPPTTSEESLAHQRVEDAIAAQRAVALLRTEARLHYTAAERCDRVLSKLEVTELRLTQNEDTNAADADTTSSIVGSSKSSGSDTESPSHRFRRSVIVPVQSESSKRNRLANQAADAAVEKEKEFVRLRRKANRSVSVIFKETEVKFNRAFQDALNSPDGIKCADTVHNICSDVGRYHKENNSLNTRQPVPDHFENPNSPEYLQWLREEASMLLETGGEFRTLVHRVAEKFNGKPVLAPVKGYKRTVQKVQEKYAGDYSRILDLSRGMIVLDTLSQLSATLNHIKCQHDLQLSSPSGAPLIARAKDRLSPAFDASAHTGGYRDVLLNLCLSGHVVELQLHLSSFLDLKNRKGHFVYEEARSIHMFNEAFTTRSFIWRLDSEENEIEALLDDISSGALTSLNLDYSEGLSNPHAQTRLAEAMLSDECRLQDISLRSCFCGDDFILKCLPLEDELLWSEDNYHGHIGRSIRLGSKIHEGTAGRISEKGVTRMIRYLNGSLRILDLEGCLDLEWYENSGDAVATALTRLADDLESRGEILLPQLQELNLKSTGLTPDGMRMLQQLKTHGHLGNVKILTGELRTGPPTKISSRTR